jgi:hypothetical protein
MSDSFLWSLGNDEIQLLLLMIYKSHGDVFIHKVSHTQAPFHSRIWGIYGTHARRSRLIISNETSFTCSALVRMQHATMIDQMDMDIDSYNGCCNKHTTTISPSTPVIRSPSQLLTSVDNGYGNILSPEVDQGIQ